ncbi:MULTISPECIES: DUF5711 family protein [unclassified Butyrivibrio]|uniref:DUF5711 family protein n=1 Tax=unclassified Butyrivibrio TaxID=2639466 RepID=UPI0008F33FF3|nr:MULTISPECIES: DUF5711 family protein [unclassified Butyrivibrio]RKM61822.1 hypothetical protein D6856_06370 [Butyrivibrio sp. XB500-5]SFV04038.1 hypothetical protein SAMN02910342_03175 [Butyrivibrio sp. INlla21]
MAEVRDFSTYAEKINRVGAQDTSERGTSYKERIRSHKLIVFFRTIVIVATIALLTVVIYVSWRDKEYSEASYTRGASITNGSDAKIVSLNGHIVQYSKDGVSCLDAGGQALWNQTYEMQSPIARTCGDAIAIGDYNGHNIYVNNVSGALGEIDTNLPIRDFCVSSQGVVAAVLDGKDVTWIYLYDAQGNTLANFKKTMKDSGYPISISISPNGELVCVSNLYPDEGAVKTSVTFSNFGPVGQNSIDNFASSFDYPNVVVPYVQFMTTDKSFAVSDDRIMFYTGAEKPVIQVENFTGDDEVRSVYFNESYVGLVFANGTDDGAYRLQVYNTSGNLVLTTYFDMEYSEIIFTNKQIVIYNEDEFILKDMNGHIKYEGTFEEPVRTVVPTATMSKFILVTKTNVDTLILK